MEMRAMPDTRAGMIDREDHRPCGKAKDESSSVMETTHHATDIFSTAFFGFWPATVWMPLPFDSRPAEQRRLRD
jgi:hypothetical protein